MADILPINFPIPTETAIASYPFSDISEGVGYVTYYGTSIYDGSAHDYFLVTDNSLYSTQSGYTATDCDLDFDVEFHTPKILKGRVIVQIPGYTGGVGSPSVTLTAKLIHYDGSTETTIGAEITLPAITCAGGSSIQDMRVGEWNVSQRNFKAGEILRLNVTATKNGGETAGVGHSPVDQVGWSVPGTLTILVPFRLNT